MAADRRDFYEILGVARTATPEEIQRAYRTLARRNHPDVNKEPGAEDRFKDITEAYDVLSDPKSRRKYDRFGSRWRQIPDDVDERAGARQRASAGAGPPGQGAGFGGRGGLGEEVDLEDLLGSIFGGGPGRGGDRFGRGPVPGADTEAEITISVEDAYHGGRRRVTLPGGPGGRTREYEVTIPPGVTDGQRIRLAGQGSGGARGGPAGDLYLVVHIAPHPRYKLSGRDINVETPVTPWEAALGATVPVETPGGTLRVDIPPGTSSGRRLRLRGRGLPNPRGTPGDLYAEVRIMVPPKPSDAERRLFEELATVSSYNPRGDR
ncbi:DnaJ C-terminal domain-containing protein [Dactylosporangium matsuzakiense]|uniref:Molecular chaperone DnaJ n=1 Tax=Dactylosporangium matsuzakiense TaxID=53360 RepID=A0A9W6KYQ8_9ACTN|nr:DnaJ C-terminal domain-containing protein [Dactylosporangium matsuzakiense]UWZ42365.1 DnaJ domain-containing protein [Dactylosporangium matsuzakiense]GLL07899.1 molecular chaperone DnaJ [Dactylosporangium matsuzakiense]